MSLELMLRVILESPYAGDVAANVEYAHRCLADCLMRGEAPFAPHLLYTAVLDDKQPEQRALGIQAGHEWYRGADLCVVYTDRGFSRGMYAGIDAATRLGVPVELRSLQE